ncbi:MAG: hypothetical protein QM778_26120 [Myxococcales bacterium]
MKRHVLILIHGITTDEQPKVREQYTKFLVAVSEAKLPLSGRPCEVQWGVPVTDRAARPDQFLSGAEAAVARRLAEKRPAGEQDRMPGSSGHDWGVWPVRGGVEKLRRSVVQFGLSDAIYYASADGEQAVRNTVFEQVFRELEPHLGDGTVVLHIVAHSLGVSVAHDFLYALFGRKFDPDYPKESEPELKPLHDENRQRRDRWRDQAEQGQLKLGTFISFASQLPLFVMRKQKLVERIAAGERLDPRVIGIEMERRDVQWAILFDGDDPLGFRTRALYKETPAICDIQVSSGLGPASAHLGYWKQEDIVKRCVALLRVNMD